MYSRWSLIKTAKNSEKRKTPRVDDFFHAVLVVEVGEILQIFAKEIPKTF